MAPIGKSRQSLGVPRIRSDTTMQGEKPTTILKSWIIKFKYGGVVVEGYKAVSENDATTLHNWRSTPIAKRIDSKTLETHSGSVYKLKGFIDEEEALEAGIPEELIEEFARGFPENWEELVKKHLQQMEAAALRRQSIHSTTTINTERDEEEARRPREKNEGLGFDETMETEGTTDDEERLREAKRRRSMQKGRQSMMHRVQPATPIEEEEEEEREKTPARRKTPARGKKTMETPVGRGRRTESREEDEKMEEEPAPTASTSRVTRTPRGAASDGKKTPKRNEKREEEEEEVFATPDEMPRVRNTDRRVVAISKQETNPRRYSLNEIPREIMEKSIPLTKWVIRFVRGGTDNSIFPHFQFKICGFRPEDLENEWSTSAIQRVVPSYIVFTSSSIYRLDGPLDVDQATAMGFPPSFITDFLMGFPDDWEERLETFFNKRFGPPPQPKIVELMPDGGTIDEELKVEETKQKDSSLEQREKYLEKTPRNQYGQKIHLNGFKMSFDEESPVQNRKRKDPTPSSSSSSCEDSESDEEELLRKEARKVEKEMRREELKAQKEAELRAKAKEEKKKRFEVKVNRTPNGVPVSRSGRTLRTPMATWAGEKITYDVDGNAVEMTGVTTTTKMTVGKTNTDQSEMLAAHYGMDSPLNVSNQREKAIAPPKACLPRTPAVKKSKAENKGYSDDETDKKIFFDDYMAMLASQAEATPAFVLKKGRRRVNKVESSDSEAEAEERRKEEKRRKKEERRRLKESEEEESSDDGWRKKRSKSKKQKVTVKKEKVTKRAPSKKRGRARKEESEEEEEEGSVHIEHDEDAVTFVPSEDGSNQGVNGYSDDEMIDVTQEEEEPKKAKAAKKPRAKVWKKEEILRLKLAIQAVPTSSADDWEKIARSVGGERTAEECKKMAKEKKMKISEAPAEPESEEDGSERGWSGAESGAASEDDEKKKRRKAKMNDETALAGVTAKKGTIQYQVEMENKKREMLMGGAPSSQDDFFKVNKARLSVIEAPLPSVAQFDPDDSLLDCLDDDDLPKAPKQRTTKTALLAAAPATPRLVELSSYEDSPATDSARRSARRSSSMFIPSPVVNQNDLTKYVHKLAQSKNYSMLSKSIADKSRMLPPPLPKGRNVARAADAIEKVENSMRNRRRRDNEMDDFDEDEENHNNVLPANF